MQLSSYLKLYPLEDQPGSLLAYSTRRASMLILDEETLQAVENNTLHPDDESLLEDLGIIVRDTEEERKSVLGMIDDLNVNSPRLNVTVLPNLDCNFACVYCFEGDAKGKFYMTDETAGQVISFIKNKFTVGKKYLNIDFFGGEPMLSSGLVKSISEEMKAFAEGRGAAYTFTLVSNGSLFRRPIAEELAALGLTTVKITLDGDADMHNRCRPFKSGAGSFETIIRNIKETCGIVKIGIGGNFDQENYERFVLLLDYLEKEGLTPDKIYKIKFDPVMKRPQNDTSPADYHDGCMSINEPWLLKAGNMLRQEILRRGYDTPKIIPTPCMIEISDAFVVNYDGVVYKCPVFVGKKGFEIGSVKDGITDYTASYKLGTYKNEECSQCEYLPLCFGGCKYMKALRDGNMHGVICQKEYFDRTLATLVSQDIRYDL